MSGRILRMPSPGFAEARCLDRLVAGGEADWALLPSHHLLRSWQMELLGRCPPGALGGRRLVLFPGLASALLGFATPDPASPAACRAAMDVVVRDLAATGRLSLLAPAELNGLLVEELLAAVGELKRAMIPAERLQAVAAEDGRLAQLVLVWRNYDEALARVKLADGEDLIDRAARLLETTPPPAIPRSLIIHGFAGFTPIHARLLRALARAGTGVTLVTAETSEAGLDLYQELARQFPEWPAEIAAEASGDQGRTAQGMSLGEDSVAELAGEGETALAVLIAREIRTRLSADPSLRPEEIAVVRRTGARDPFLASILARHGLPAAPPPPALLALNGVGTLLAALDCMVKDWPRRSVLRLARAVLVKEEAFLADALAGFSARAGLVRSRAAWEEMILLEGVAGEDEAPEKPFSEAQQALQAVRRLAAALDRLPERGTLAQFLDALAGLLGDWNLRERWWPEIPEPEILTAYAREQAGLTRLLEDLTERARMEQALGRERSRSLAEFAAELRRLAAGFRLSAPSQAAGLAFLEPAEVRGRRFRLVFLVGLAEAEFPRLPAESWLLPEDLRGLLSGGDWGLEKREDLIREERQLLEGTIAAAADRLYLCWSTVDRRGENTVPSPFLRELRTLFAPARRELRAAELLPSTPAEAHDDAGRQGRLLVDLLWREHSAEELPLILAAYEHHRVRIGELLVRAAHEETRRREGEREGVALGDAPDIQAGLAARFGPASTLAVTALEEYALCPFRFFGHRLLGLAAMIEPAEDPSGLQLGQVYHAILARFFRGLGREGLRRDKLDDQLRRLAEIVAAEFAALGGQARTPVARRLVELGRRTCLQRLGALVRTEARRAERLPGWRTAHCELGFGFPEGLDLDQASRPEPLILGTGPDRARLAGKIDRIDLSEDGYYLIYDYKLGATPRPGEVLRGRSLQIPIYLLAGLRLLLPSLSPAGGAYYSLRDLTPRPGLWRASLQARTGVSKRLSGNLGEEEWAAKMDELTRLAMAAIAALRRGDFRPSPQSCPDLCDLRAVCRQEVAR